MVSAVREVLPGREYFIPKTTEKSDPMEFMVSPNPVIFENEVFCKAMPLYKSIYSAFTGISPLLAQELCFRSGLDSDRSALSYREESPEAVSKLYQVFCNLFSEVKEGNFTPAIVYENEVPVDFAAVKLTMYVLNFSKDFPTVSALLETYYAEKNAYTRIRQKSADLRKVGQTTLERTVRKYDLHCQQMKDT